VTDSQQQHSPPPSSAGTRRAARRAGVGTESVRQRVFADSDLSGYSFKDRLTIYVADFSFYVLIKFICSTIRWQTRGGEHLESIFADGHRAIFTFWHECIFTGTWTFRNRGIVVMSSQSRDAEYVGRLIKRFGYGTARGSHTRGGSRAMAELSACLEHGLDVAFTIDGPRGPALIAKPGAVTLARHSGQAILPFHVTTRRMIRIKSWDRLQLPLPFTRGLVLIGEPIYVPRNASAEQVREKQEQLQSVLDGLRNEGERWRSEGKPE